MHSSEREIMRKIDNNRQSMILIGNHDARNELADHTKGFRCVDQGFRISCLRKLRCV